MNPKLPKFRFYCDENFPIQTGKFLKSLSHNVEYSISRQKTRSLSDYAQIKKATKEQRIFISLDRDFRANKGLIEMAKKSYGVIIIQGSDLHPNRINRILKKHLKNISENKIKGKICRLSVDKISYE